MKPKIFICGPSGVGKTTLAHHISQKYNIPFVSTSGKVLWRHYNISSHKELIERTMADPMGFGMEYQVRLLEHRNSVLNELDSFVTDRSPIDNLVYFISQLGAFVDENTVGKYIALCENSLRLGNKIMYIPFTKEVQLEADGARITNRYYQQYITNIFDMVIFVENYLSVCKSCVDVIRDWDWQRRESFVSFLMKNKFQI